MKREETRALNEAGILVCVAVVLDLIFGSILPLPYGGHIGLSMLPIFILAYRRGLKYGLLGGLAFGLISFTYKPYFLNFLQFTFDYVFAFGLLGIGAALPKNVTKVKRFVLIIVIGSLFRYISATIAGAAYWAEYIPEEMQWFDNLLGTSIATNLTGNSLIYLGSMIYNGAYLIPSAILCVVFGIILYKRGTVTQNLTTETR